MQCVQYNKTMHHIRLFRDVPIEAPCNLIITERCNVYSSDYTFFFCHVCLKMSKEARMCYVALVVAEWEWIAITLASTLSHIAVYNEIHYGRVYGFVLYIILPGFHCSNLRFLFSWSWSFCVYFPRWIILYLLLTSLSQFPDKAWPNIYAVDSLKPSKEPSWTRTAWFESNSGGKISGS